MSRTGIAFSRRDSSWAGDWFRTTDKLLMMLVFALIGCGIIAVAAASPAAARRLSGTAFTYDSLYFLKRQVMWVLLGLPVLLGVSMLPIRLARRAAVLGCGVFGVLLVLVLVGGTSDGATNGATRWIMLAGIKIQPSEFLKPLFIVTTAWLLSLRFEDPSLPTMQLSFGIFAVFAALLLMQPDLGQTVLMGAIWLMQAVLAGMPLLLVGLIILAGLVGIGIAYVTLPHVADRIDKFVTGEGDTYQIDKALDCFRAGGLFGVGPGEGVMKFRLPEPQTDYIFSVIGEEFGIITCLFIAVLYITIVVRVFLSLLDEEDPFIMLAASGLVAQFGLQATINIAVNLKLAPSKGMTLPFISHGGSSFLALCLGMGLLLALTRRNPFLKASPYVERWRGA
ncbi:cell division protein FtsW [Polymorphobacter multimanifer]|uniref:Probable peptidoglycan glycosyltransferase FtsW n=1 Tax=Polymorphobacter multimanifer TaxID=1070431 RepID=A0A841L4Q0_9SPHN|nr:putative peptidoglycan glycosyltransferase FtsW [Polymorphobacter multimanifer]MBB6227604.1 cell division protein FtsW [Polymorphobacter multimanifer]